MPDCIFCKIVAKEVPATIRYETDEVLAFDDATPATPIHILVVPKRHMEHLGNATEADDQALRALLPAVRAIAAQEGIDGFKLVVNNGKAYGQTVAHLHLHMLSGHVAPSVLQSL